MIIINTKFKFLLSKTFYDFLHKLEFYGSHNIFQVATFIHKKISDFEVISNLPEAYLNESFHQRKEKKDESLHTLRETIKELTINKHLVHEMRNKFFHKISFESQLFFADKE